MGVKIVVSKDVTFNEQEFPWQKLKEVPSSSYNSDSDSERESEVMHIGIPLEHGHGTTEIEDVVPIDQGNVDMKPAARGVEDEGELTVED